MAGVGRARAALGLTLLSTLERDHPELATVVRAKISENTRAEYDTVATLRWVSMHAHMDLSDRIREAVGMTNNEDFWRRAFFEVLNRPLFASFIRTFQAILGPQPKVIVRTSPAVFTRLFENIGTLTMRSVEGQDYFAVVTFRGFPATEHTMMCFIEGTSGALASAGFVANMKLEVTRLSVDPAGHFELTLGEAPKDKDD